MLDFYRSSFLWKHHPWSPDEYYRYPGGFVGTPGQVYHVRFRLDATATIVDEQSGQQTELFIGAPCRSEYTIATRNLFQVPSAEFRLAFSCAMRLAIAARPSYEAEPVSTQPLTEIFQEHKLDLRTMADSSPVASARELVEATLQGDLLNATTTYRDAERGVRVTVEYPINLINLNEEDQEFQVCTGPVILPDLATWDGQEVQRVFLAHVSFSSFDSVEFILQREVEADAAARLWLDQPRGRDRFELRDPSHEPSGYPPHRPRPTVYHETWELSAQNVVTRSRNGDSVRGA
jgi:hypothetical protein